MNRLFLPMRRLRLDHRIIRSFSELATKERAFAVTQLLNVLKESTHDEEQFVNHLFPYLKDPKKLEEFSVALGEHGFLNVANDFFEKNTEQEASLPVLWSCSAVMKGWLESGSFKPDNIKFIVQNTSVLNNLNNMMSRSLDDTKRVEFCLNYARLLTGSYASIGRMNENTPIDTFIDYSVYPKLLKEYKDNETLVHQTLMSLVTILPLETQNEVNDQATLEMSSALVDILRQYAGNEGIIKLCLRCLSCITLHEDGKNVDSVLESEVIPVMQLMFREYLNDRDIIFGLLCLMRNVSAYRPGSVARDKVYNSKIVPCITQVMRTHFDSEMLCWVSTSILLNLSLPPPDKQLAMYLKHNGILEMIDKVGKQHRERLNIQQNISGIIMGIGYFNAEIQDTIIQMGFDNFLIHETPFADDMKIQKFLSWFENARQTQHLRPANVPHPSEFEVY